MRLLLSLAHNHREPTISSLGSMMPNAKMSPWRYAFQVALHKPGLMLHESLQTTFQRQPQLSLLVRSRSHMPM
jgi:hypothetical protein